MPARIISSKVNGQDSDFYVHPHLVPSYDPCKGRMLRVSALVPAGTVLLVDTPYAIVPTIEPGREDALICSNLMCSRPVQQNGLGSRCCNNCIKDVIWCNDVCRADDQARHGFECAWLKKRGEKIRLQEGEYDFVTLWHVVRLLAGRHLEMTTSSSACQSLWRTGFKQGWESVEECCAYLDSWPKSQIEHWKRLAQTYLNDASELPGLPSFDEVLSVICKEETNTFGLYPGITGPLYMIDRPVPRGESYGLSLYPRAAMFNHSCLPNVTHKPNSRGRMVYTAARDILEDEECMITYFDLTQFRDVRTRQQRVQDQFRFLCTCDRCVEEEAQENLNGMDLLPFDF
ncbi:hypothetical protein BGZ63DRAFT_359244 [Mariannaea sp. PMI_226]|nr:hypothetical protein BGZ63DRAFT_359244 [Mariannaea sp. PMI_226]